MLLNLSTFEENCLSWEPGLIKLLVFKCLIHTLRAVLRVRTIITELCWGEKLFFIVFWRDYQWLGCVFECVLIRLNGDFVFNLCLYRVDLHTSNSAWTKSADRIRTGEIWSLEVGLAADLVVFR